LIFDTIIFAGWLGRVVYLFIGEICLRDSVRMTRG